MRLPFYILYCIQFFRRSERSLLFVVIFVVLIDQNTRSLSIQNRYMYMYVYVNVRDTRNMIYTNYKYILQIYIYI